MRNPKSTPLQRLNDAADRIRDEYMRALETGPFGAILLAHDKARALGLEIRVDSKGLVTVSRPHREEEK